LDLPLPSARGTPRTTDEGQSVKQSRIPLNGTVLTHGSGKMSNVVFGTLSGHHILEVGGKISGTVPLEQIVEQVGIVCFGLRESQDEPLRCRAGKLTRHVAVFVVAIIGLQVSSSGL
jgi:hypothetical protein